MAYKALILEAKNDPILRCQGLSSDDEFFCEVCGAQGRLLETNGLGHDAEGEAYDIPAFQVLCTVCDVDHPEFTADIFRNHIAAAESDAFRFCQKYRESDRVQELYWNRVLSDLTTLAAGMDADRRALFEEVALSRGWSLEVPSVDAEDEDPDFNIMAESEVDFEEERYLQRFIAVLSDTLAILSPPRLNISLFQTL
jgi:hypothetical protein